MFAGLGGGVGVAGLGGGVGVAGLGGGVGAVAGWTKLGWTKLGWTKSSVLDGGATAMIKLPEPENVFNIELLKILVTPYKNTDLNFSHVSSFLFCFPFLPHFYLSLFHSFVSLLSSFHHFLQQKI